MFETCSSLKHQYLLLSHKIRDIEEKLLLSFLILMCGGQLFKLKYFIVTEYF